MSIRNILSVASVGAFLAAAAVAFGANGYTLFGDAEYVSPGNASPRAVQLRSDAVPEPECGGVPCGGVDFDVPAGTTFDEFATLATDYKFEADDSCGGGSPRFQINVEDSVSGDAGNIHVYIGPPPNYTLCPPNIWSNTGDLLEGVNPIDTGQLDGGTFYDPYATALAKYGDYIVTGVQLVVDASWFFADVEQTAFVDNTNIDGTVYTYEIPQPESKDDCKKGGWQELARADGTPFKNQGDCIQYFNTGK